MNSAGGQGQGGGGVRDPNYERNRKNRIRRAAAKHGAKTVVNIVDNHPDHVAQRVKDIAEKHEWKDQEALQKLKGAPISLNLPTKVLLSGIFIQI